MRRAPAVLAALAAVVGLLIAVAAGSSGPSRRASGTAGSPATAPAAGPGRRPPAGAAPFAAQVDRAQAVIDSPSSTSLELQDAGRLQQLATMQLGRESPRTRRATMALLDPSAAAGVRADLAAADALSALVAPRRRLPPWRIDEPPAPRTLLRYYRAAQSQFGVPWQYLAAIEFIETGFGRVRGPSTAGALGPMQFLPSTWARYGRGSIDDPHDAILGAARYLAANGAPDDMADALYHYNNSRDYVRAVEDYADRMRADPRAYYGYYWWQVIYAVNAGPPTRSVILPVGYPAVRPRPVSGLGAGR